MNGCVIANTPIAVDFWKVRECPQARFFFLTHLHGDHIAGLTSSWHYPIYCSEVTGRLLKHKYQIKDEYIKVLEIGTATIVYLDRDQTEQMTVTALDANHCPGAAMFLFEGYFGRILHTGDFRFKPDMLETPPLSNLAGRIDILYLDNTYCSPRCAFPDRDQATREIIHIIQSHPDHDVVIGMRSLGKEELLQEIAVQCENWISVSSSYYNTLKLIEAKNVFQENCDKCRIKIVPFHLISNRFVNKVNEENPTIVILPTALYVGIDAEPYCNQDNVFIVPYSDHSSYTELEKFVSFLRPCSIIPVVKSKSRGPFGVSLVDRSDMSCFDRFLSKEGKATICVPESVKSFMSSHRANPTLSDNPSRAQSNAAKKLKSKRRNERGITYLSPSKESSSCDMNDMTSSVNKSSTSNTKANKKAVIHFDNDRTNKKLYMESNSIDDIANNNHTEVPTMDTGGFEVESNNDISDSVIVRILEENLETVNRSNSTGVSDEDIFANDSLEVQTSQLSQHDTNTETVNTADTLNHKVPQTKTTRHLNPLEDSDICASDTSVEYVSTESLNQPRLTDIDKSYIHECATVDLLSQDTDASSMNEIVISDSISEEGKASKYSLLTKMFGYSQNSSSSDNSIQNKNESIACDLTDSDGPMLCDEELPNINVEKINKESEKAKKWYVSAVDINKCRRVNEEELPNISAEQINKENDKAKKWYASAVDISKCPREKIVSKKIDIIDLTVENVLGPSSVRFDISRINVVPYSARTKNKRRYRLYRNLMTGINKMAWL